MGFKVSIIRLFLVSLTSLKKFRPDSFFFFVLEANTFVLYSFLSHGALCSLDPVLSSTYPIFTWKQLVTHKPIISYVCDVYPRLKKWVLKILIHWKKAVSL